MAKNKAKMNKFLTGAVTATLVASAIVPVAAAAETSSFPDVTNAEDQAAAEKAVELGFFQGAADGNFNPYVNITRGQVAKTLARYVVAQDGSKDLAEYIAKHGLLTSTPFNDVPVTHSDLELQASAAIVKHAGVFTGSNNNLMPTSDITRAQMASVIVRAFDLKDLPGDLSKVTDADKVDASHQANIHILSENGVTTETAFRPGEYVKRIQMAKFLNRSNDVVHSDAVITSVSATNTKTLEVKFQGKVPADATLKVTRGTATVNVQETTFNDARSAATLTFPNKLVEGEYTVTLTAGEVTSTGTVTISEEKIESIEILSDVAVLGASDKHVVTVGYKVVNQYGEDVSDTASLVATASPLASVNSTVNASNGTLTITNLDGNSDEVNFTVDSNLTVTLLDSATGKFASKAVKVSAESRATSFEVKGLYNADDKSPQVGDTAGNYKVLFTAKDQYGNNISQANFKNTDIIVTTTNPAVVPNIARTGPEATVSEVTVDGKKYLALTLEGTLGEGTANINILSKTAGNLVSTPVKVDAAFRVETLTLSTPDLAVAGEKIKIPFTALDQNGKAVTDLSKLDAVTFALAGATDGTNSIDGSNVKFERDLATNTNVLVVDATTLDELATGTRNVTLIATTPSLKIVQQSFTLRANKKVSTVSGTKDLVTNLLEDQTATIAPANVIFKDQYGRDITPTIGSSTGNYKIQVKSSNTSVVEIQDSNGTAASNLVIDADAGNHTASGKLVAIAKGSATITLTLLDNTGATVANSSYTYNSTVFENKDIASYELGTVATIADDFFVENSHSEELVVYGVSANGQKVQLDANAFTFTSGHAALSYNPSTGDLTVDSTDGGTPAATTISYGSGSTADLPFVVTIIGKDGPVHLNGKVTASKAAATIESFSIKSTTNMSHSSAEKVSASVISADVAEINSAAEVALLVEDAIAVKDQYGLAFPVVATNWSAGTIGNVIISNITGNRAIDSVQSGDTFKVTLVAKNGKTYEFTVAVN